MNILLISQCQKRALTETRRILDQFGERKGERTWQTPITQIGLDMLRKMLRKTARKNTAVSCHWIRSANLTELLWIVGDAKQFNAEGSVPTNLTERNILRTNDENDWHSLTLIRMAAEMAALWHDFGKASVLFQNKLAGNAKVADPYRHEWVSLRLFQAFVGSDSDAEWLARLKNIAVEGDGWQQRLICDGLLPNNDKPFAKLPPFAHLVGWLVLSHHRLPSPKHVAPIALEKLSADWCVSNVDASSESRKACWEFTKNNMPDASATWRARARDLADEIHPKIKRISTALAQPDPYVWHLARLSLMLGDHYFSSIVGKPIFRDSTYLAYANTDRQTRQRKQRLDEHLIGVAEVTAKIVAQLPNLSGAVSYLDRIKAKQIAARTNKVPFLWQNNAYDLANSLKDRANTQGFFGINLASTGCGKTLANAKIMLGIANRQFGARFAVALGLRTLTLQTGEALRTRLGLAQTDLAVMVGNAAVRELFERNAESPKPLDQILSAERAGSESANDLIPDGVELKYQGGLGERGFGKWLRCAHNPRAGQLLDAPILVCTIDHLMPSVESTRGGHQIVPLLRLLSSDLVLDEPDDFGLEDLPALARLVYFAGLFGSRVLLSSATLAPAIVQGLYEAYRAGRVHFQANRRISNQAPNIVCAWFDEFDCTATAVANEHDFQAAHHRFVERRLQALDQKTKVRRRARIVDLPACRPEQVTKIMAIAFHGVLHELHNAHYKIDPHTGKRVSFGLIRMANIDPLIDIAKLLFQFGAKPDHRIHLCVYHSRHPLLVRAEIERTLDTVLNRTQRLPFDNPLIRASLDQYSEPNQIFVVLASPVIETGRDLCADWAITEPSSMRSLIQLAGRVMRHLDPGKECSAPNIVILDQNRLALRNPSGLAFIRPGFESTGFALRSKRMRELLTQDQIDVVSAKPRLIKPANLDSSARLSLVGLEHERLEICLLAKTNSEEKNARRFWESVSQFTGFEQSDTRFRKSRENTRYVQIPDDAGTLVFHRFDEQYVTHSVPFMFEKDKPLSLHPLISHFATPDYLIALTALSVERNMELSDAAKRYGTIDLPADVTRWIYQPMLGFRREKAANEA